MAKRRDEIAMNEDELWHFIEERKSIHVATLNRDGSVHLVPLWFAVDEQTIILETFTKSQKVRNLERDPRVSAMLETGTEYSELRGATLYARAELVREVERVHELHMKVLRRNAVELPEAVLEKASREMAPKKTAILIRPHKVMSWDHRKLGGVY